MENSVATASRNLLRIKLRKYRYLTYRGIQEMARKVAGGIPEEIDSIMFYPRVSREEDLQNLINQLAWYLPEQSSSDTNIYFSLAPNLNLESGTSAIPPHQAEYPSDHLSINQAEDPKDTAEKADVILCWKHAITPLILRNIHKVYIIDPNYYSLIESDRWIRVSGRVNRDTENHSRQNFKDLERLAEEYSDAYVFATGPSLDSAYDFSFPDDSLKVICNSIVSNEDLLSHIQPDILVFADPVFHFGPSKYADKFRRDAVKAVLNRDIFTVIPRRFHRLLLGHFPELSNKLISTPTTSLPEPRFPTSNDLTVMSTNNIMTRYMVPVATSLTDDIYFLGADGREDDESYFWEHSDEAQYTGLMETVVKCHPSFFRDRIYTDYYQQHIETFSDMLEYGEREGKNYYSLTDSHIPCLNSRKVEDGIDIKQEDGVSG